MHNRNFLAAAFALTVILAGCNRLRRHLPQTPMTRT